ncbi:zinc finger protein [Pyrenophora seminiperda CCB06]|uniref:Zinc finger protein n=1 Tax=Pyrenophora seminiperda CCB06 TaxID=1302712 RepID=A0A3M7MA56_9PLEO|nr:zinc finger protein [Pyrenophora seminiperda CCB06]
MSRRFGSPTPYDEAEGQRRKQKRYMSRSDEEIREEMDTGGLSYRAGWPKLQPLPLGTVLVGARAHIPDATQRLEAVRLILETQGLLYTTGVDYRFAYRLPCDATEEDDMSEYLTLLITLDMINQGHKVEHTIMRVRALFRNYSSTAAVQIECLDYRAHGGLLSHPISHTEIDLCQKWEATLPIVLSLLDDQAWLSVELLRRGLVDENCLPTIVISTPSARDSKWSDAIVPLILAEINNTGPGFVVEILFGVTLLLGGKNHHATDVVDGTSYMKDLRMGSSIGLSNDDDGCSTLGGSVTLDGEIRCGITNWHCVRDDRLDKGITLILLANAQANHYIVVSQAPDGALRVGNKTLAAAPQHILSPATLDHNGYLGRLQEQLKELTSQASRGMEQARTWFKDMDNEYERCDKFARKIGHVYAGSGRRIVTANKHATDEKTGKLKGKSKMTGAIHSFPLDWALIRLDNVNERDVINLLPTVTPPAKYKPAIVPGKQCHRWTSFDASKEDVQVVKYGRTSGWTFGHINACLIAINPDSDKEIAGVYGFSKEAPGACFGVASRPARDEPFGGGLFIKSGDSGSILVHEESGTQLGLLFGVTCGGQGMFMPLDLVFQDIKNITGKSVIDPPYVGKRKFSPNQTTRS